SASSLDRPALSTLSLHDALPIFLVDRLGDDAAGFLGLSGRLGGVTRVRPAAGRQGDDGGEGEGQARGMQDLHRVLRVSARRIPRSEEHTSELQSRENLVCRLLLE